MASIALPARITMNDARATLAQLQPQLQAADAPVIDASALVELDTAALALLLDCQRQAHARGKALQVVGAPAKLGQLAALYGVADLLGLSLGSSPPAALNPASRGPAPPSRPGSGC